MFYNLQFKRPLSKQEEAQINWLQSQMHQAGLRKDEKEKTRILRELIALLNKIDSDWSKRKSN